MRTYIFTIIFALALLSLGCAKIGPDDAGVKVSPASSITNFEECAAAGHPVMESYPRQCRAGGYTFTEVLAEPVRPLEERPTTSSDEAITIEQCHGWGGLVGAPELTDCGDEVKVGTIEMEGGTRICCAPV